MELQTCRRFCNNCLPREAEQNQEEYVRNSIDSNRINKKYSENMSTNKNVFSFKLQQHRRFEDSDKIMNHYPIDGKMTKIRNIQIPTYVIGKHGASSTQPVGNRYYSPPIKQQTSSKKIEGLSDGRKESYNLQSLLSPRVCLQPKVVFHFNTPNPSPSPQISKMAGKRLRTNEEETEYSSKHSQIQFKTSFQIPDNTSWVTFQKGKEERNQVTFREPYDESQQNSQASLRTISENMPSSQQHSRLPTHIQYYHSGATMQTIITSTQIKSRHSSKFSNQLRMLRQVKEEKPVAQLSFDNQNDQNCSITFTPKAHLSPREEYALPNDPNLFYQANRPEVSPRISVLSFSKHNQNQQDEQEELRDVIDHNFLASQQCSRNNSPKVSLNPSLKNVSDLQHYDRPRHYQRSPLHSRQGSWQLGPLMSTRAKMQRTNTIESIQSFSSEMISCLDIKFMQKNRGRRGVSRLI